jgi:hypothetical protein
VPRRGAIDLVVVTAPAIAPMTWAGKRPHYRYGCLSYTVLAGDHARGVSRPKVAAGDGYAVRGAVPPVVLGQGLHPLAGELTGQQPGVYRTHGPPPITHAQKPTHN